MYGTYANGRWTFKDCTWAPGEFFFDEEELEFAQRHMTLSIVIEPRVKMMGACAGDNKRWPADRYHAVAKLLEKSGWECVQLVPPEAGPLLPGIKSIRTPSFRHAAAMLTRAKLYIGPEGGLHHATAAVGKPAVVLFGGFNTPRSTGYATHYNITVGDEPCGRSARCEHCIAAMNSITVERVLIGAMEMLSGRQA